MDNKTNMQVNENPKEQLAREIAKNMSVKRRKNAFDEEEHLAVNNFNKNDFVKEPPSKTKIFVVGLLSFLIAFSCCLLLNIILLCFLYFSVCFLLLMLIF